MDASAAGPLVSGSSVGQLDAEMPGLPSGPGWLVLRDCLIGGGSPVDLALLHPKIGVALVNFADAKADASDRFRRALDARRFPAIFGGYPPIVRAVVPADRLADLGQILSAQFRAEPPPSLQGGDAWVPTARAALEARPAADGPASPGVREQDVASWRMALVVVASAASVAVMAAVAVIPPPQGPAGVPAPETAVAATPQRPVGASPRTAPPAVERVAAPEAVVFRAAPPANTAAGADVIVPKSEETGPSPVTAVDDGRAEPPLPAPALSVATDPAGESPRRAPFPAATAPEASGVAEEPQPPARTRVAGGAGAPTRATPTAALRSAPASEWSGEKRCRAILVRTTLGEGLSDADKEHLRRRCQ